MTRSLARRVVIVRSTPTREPTRLDSHPARSLAHRAHRVPLARPGAHKVHFTLPIALYVDQPTRRAREIRSTKLVARRRASGHERALDESLSPT